MSHSTVPASAALTTPAVAAPFFEVTDGGLYAAQRDEARRLVALATELAEELSQ